MLRLPPIIVCFLSFVVFQLQAQTKVVGECAITYDIRQISINGDTSLIGQKQIFIKGNSCKTVLKTPAFTQTLIFNTQQDTAIILKEIGLNKFLQYILYTSIQPVNLVASKKNGSTSSVLDYPCENIILTWADGNAMEVTYTTLIVPTVTVYEQAFKEIPGLVMRYQLTTKEGNKILYSASKVDLSPITLNVFEVNKSNFQQIN
jgi:hypothetical protein